MNADAKVSVVVTTFNQGPLAVEAIDSVLAQSHGNVETIVVDDGSTDDTEERLSRRFGNRIRYLNQENRGQGAARNLGIRAASGKYVQFLDGDDLLLPDKLSLQMKVLATRPGFQAAYCDYANFSGASVERLTAGIHKNRYRSGTLWTSLLRGNFLLNHTPLVEIGRVRQVGGFDEDRSLSGCEDYDLWLRLSYQGCRFYYLDEVLALYRHSERSASSDQHAQRLRTVTVLNKIPTYAKGLSAEDRAALGWYRSRLSLLVAHGELSRRRPVRCLRHLSKALRYDPGVAAFILQHLLAPRGKVGKPAPAGW